jgi:hypothetical protein
LIFSYAVFALDKSNINWFGLVIVGGMPPLVLLAVGAAIYWVVLGFRSGDNERAI